MNGVVGSTAVCVSLPAMKTYGNTDVCRVRCPTDFLLPSLSLLFSITQHGFKYPSPAAPVFSDGTGVVEAGDEASLEWQVLWRSRQFRLLGGWPIAGPRGGKGKAHSGEPDACLIDAAEVSDPVLEVDVIVVGVVVEEQLWETSVSKRGRRFDFKNRTLNRHQPWLHWTSSDRRCS